MTAAVGICSSKPIALSASGAAVRSSREDLRGFERDNAMRRRQMPYSSLMPVSIKRKNSAMPYLMSSGSCATSSCVIFSVRIAFVAWIVRTRQSSAAWSRSRKLRPSGATGQFGFLHAIMWHEFPSCSIIGAVRQNGQTASNASISP